MDQMELSTKTEVEAAAISTAHIDSEIHLNRMKGEPGLLQSEDSEPVLSLKEEILEDAAAMDQMEMPVSNEVEMAATYSERSNSEINLDFFKQGPGLLQSVKSEPFFTYEALLKEEILKDRTRDGSEQQCVHVASTSTGTGRVNEACSTSLHDLLNVKYESSEMDIGPIVLQHMDTHYTIKKNRMSTATEKNSIVDDSDEAMPGSGVRKGSVENKRRDGIEQQYLQSRSTAASPGSLYEANSTNKDDWLHVKQELADIDIGPTVLQHMDIHHALNKSPVDGCNEAMRYIRIKNSAENKLRDSLEPHEAIKKERSRPLQSLQHTVHEDCLTSLCGVDVMRLNIFQCDLCHVVYTEKVRLLQHLQTGHACPSRTSLSIQFRQTNKRNVSATIRGPGVPAPSPRAPRFPRPIENYDRYDFYWSL